MSRVVRVAPTVSGVFPLWTSFIYCPVYVPVSLDGRPWSGETVLTASGAPWAPCWAGQSFFFSVSSSTTGTKIPSVKGNWKLEHVKWVKCTGWHFLKDALFSFCSDPRKGLLFLSLYSSESWALLGITSCPRFPKLASCGLHGRTVCLYSPCSFFVLELFLASGALSRFPLQVFGRKYKTLVCFTTPNIVSFQKYPYISWDVELRSETFQPPGSCC